MKTMRRIGAGTLALSATVLIGGGRAMAQDADPQAQVEEIQARYEEAIAAQDWEAMGSLFTENATFLPMTGGMFEGPEGIRGYHEESGLTALDATSTRTEMLGENLILDIGTFTATATTEEGDMELQGEYVVLAEVGEDGLRIRTVTAFPVRQPPGAPAEQ